MTPGRLQRQLGFWDAVAINVGIIIGVGIFRVPAEVSKYLQSPSMILLAWGIGCLITLLGVLCYAELSSRFPETGGTYIFLRESYGKGVAFLFGWIEFWIFRTGSLAAVAYIFSAYLHHFFSFGEIGEKIVAIAAIAGFTILNIAGLHVGIRVQRFLTSLKILSLVVMSLLIFKFQPPLVAIPSTSGFDAGDIGRLAPAMIAILFTYGGWHECTFMSGEFKDTRKELPFALITSALIVTVLYLLMNAAYLKAMPPSEMVQSKAIAADIFRNLFGVRGEWIITAAVLISAGGALNSTVMTGARIPFAMGCDHRQFSWLGRVNGRFNTPVVSLLLNSIWACVLVLWGNFEQLLFFSAFAKWLFFTLAATSVFILRRKAGKTSTSFSMFGYPVVPFLFTLSCLWIFVTVVQHAVQEALIGTAILLSGVPVYLWMRGRKQEKVLEEVSV